MALPRLLTSAKFQASFLQTLLIGVPLWFTLTDKNLDREHKQQACIAAIIASSAVWGVAIHATGQEDAAAKSNVVQPTAPLDPPPTVPTGSMTAGTKAAIVAQHAPDLSHYQYIPIKKP